MPIWVPPTPPRENEVGAHSNDWYIDQLSLMYESEPMTEDQLPPVWVGNKDGVKKLKVDAERNALVGTSLGLKAEGFGGISGEVGHRKSIGHSSTWRFFH